MILIYNNDYLCDLSIYYSKLSIHMTYTLIIKCVVCVCVMVGTIITTNRVSGLNVHIKQFIIL